MKRIITIITLSGLLIFTGCKKTDNAAAWVGVYKGTGLTNTINQITISEAGNNSLKILLQIDTVISGTAIVYTYATIQKATVSDANTAVINEIGAIANTTGSFHFLGGCSLNGSLLEITGTATNTANASDIRGEYFNGNKQ